MKNLAHYWLLYFLMMSALALGQPIPTITTFAPASGAVGTAVTITGTNFSATPSEDVVYFGAAKATVNSATVSQLTVKVPNGTIYQPITVTVNGLTAYSHSPFIVTFPFTGSIGASFASKTDFWAGAQTKWGTVCDLDGDGKTDVVATDQGSNVVSVFRNVSTPGSISGGSFQPKVDFATGPGPYAVATGDLDGDGKPDLVATNSGGTSISVLRNTSTSGMVSFSPGIEFEAVVGPVFVAINDLDLDGKPDIAVTSTNNFGEGVVSIFRNTSTVGSISPGSFAPRVDFIAGHGGVWCVVLEDVDGDGKSDLTVTSGGDALVSIFRNISTPGSITSGSFEPKVDFATGGYPAIAFLADLDGDHRPDLAVGNAGGNSISIFRNISSPGIINSASFDTRVDLDSNGPWNPAAGDLTGDGKLDLIVRVNGTLSIFKNNSSPGTITAASFSPPYNVETGGNPLGMSVADMDGDGKADLTLSNEGSNVISVFRNTDILEPPPGESIPSIAAFAPTIGPAGTAVTITGSNFNATPADNAVYFGATKGTVNLATASQLKVTVPIGATYQPITVTPLNGLTAYSQSPFIVTFPFTGSIGASFLSRTDYWAGNQTRWETVRDIDGDGKTDIISAD